MSERLNTTPAQVLAAGALLGIDPSSEAQTHLLAVARALLELPLPWPWARNVDMQDGASVVFVNKRSQRTSVEHPQLSEFQHLTSRLAAMPPKGHQHRTCMEFTAPDGSTYTHNFRAPEAAPSEGPVPKAAEAVAAAAASSQEEARSDPPATASTEALQAEPQSTPSSEDQQAPGSATDSTSAPEAEAATASSGDGAERLQEDQAAASEATNPDQSTPAATPAPADRMIPPVPTALLEAFNLLNKAPTPEPVGDTGVRAGVRRLRYFSWWYEDIESSDLTFRVNCDSVVGGGLKKRYVTLDYNLDTGSFSMSSANEDQELRVDDIPVLNKSGSPVEIWDLHVSAVLTALGKKLTLHKADLETSLWNDRHAARLKQLKADLLAELQKYKPRAHKAAVVFDRGDRVNSGGLSLRYTVEQIKSLVDDLQQYRPAKAEQYRAKINIKL